MNISSVSSSYYSGISSSLNRLDKAASAVSSSGATGDAANLSRAIVDQQSSAIEVKANVDVIRSKDQMIGSLIDIVA